MFKDLKFMKKLYSLKISLIHTYNKDKLILQKFNNINYYYLFNNNEII